MPRMSRTTTSRALFSAATRALAHARSRAGNVVRCPVVASFKGPPSRVVIRGRSAGTGELGLSPSRLRQASRVTSGPDQASPRTNLPRPLAQGPDPQVLLADL